MKNLFLLSVLTLTLFSGVRAHATIPQDFYQGLGKISLQKISQQRGDGNIEVLDAVRIHTLYSDVQLIEIAVADIAFAKQIYVYDRVETYEFARALTIRMVDDLALFRFQDGAAMYLGKTDDGRDRFVLSLVSVVRPDQAAPVDIYVQSGGMQLQVLDVRFTP